jgi:hypothetical protein
MSTQPIINEQSHNTTTQPVVNQQPHSNHPLIHEKARGEPYEHDSKVGTGPETRSAGATAETNPTIVPPPSHGNPPVTSADHPATKGNMPTSQHPAAAGPHPPMDATHHQEKVMNLPHPLSTNAAPSNRLRRLERGNLSDITNMLSRSYSSANSFIVLPSTEEDDPHAAHHQPHQTHTHGEQKLAHEVKKDQGDIDKLNSRRDYIFKKIGRALMKNGAAWGLYDATNTHLVASALLIPPAREYHQNPDQLRLEDPNINEGQASHYVPLAKLFTKKNPKQLLLLGPSLIKRIRLELRLFDTAMTVHQRPEVAFLYFFGDNKTTGQNDNKDPSDPAEKSLSQHPNPLPTLAQNEPQYSANVNTLLEELGKRYPIQVHAQRYRDNQRFVMLLQNGFQEIDKVQGFHQRRKEEGVYAEGHILGIIPPGHKEGHDGHHRKEGPDMVYESCFITLTRGIYPSLKNVENDVRGIVPQKEVHGVISDPTTVLPPVTVPSKQTDAPHHTVQAHPANTAVPSNQTGTTYPVSTHQPSSTVPSKTTEHQVPPVLHS